MSWQDVMDAIKERDESGSWLKLSGDGDRAIVVFLGDPYVRQVVFTGKGYEEYNPSTHSDRPITRGAVNVFDVAANRIKIWEASLRFFQDLLKVSQEYLDEGGLGNRFCVIQRIGAAKSADTRYQIMPKKELSAQEKATIHGLKQIDLKEFYSQKGKAVSHRSDDDALRDGFAA